jgi:hypothetical protein
MNFSLTGDFSKLEAFGRRVEKLGSDASMRALARDIADEALFQVQKGFVEQRDPYGSPWAPKKFPDGRSILRGTSGRLERSFVRLYVGPDAVIIGSKAAYARFIQSGTGLYGPSKERIAPKKGKRAMRFKSGGRWMFAKSVEGSPARMMVPSGTRLPPDWARAIKQRTIAFLRNRLIK